MEKTFNLTIISPEKKIFEGPVASLVVPAELGYLGVLANHAPLIAKLKPGKIIMRTANGPRILSNIEQGFLDVGRQGAKIVLEKIKEE